MVGYPASWLPDFMADLLGAVGWSVVSGCYVIRTGKKLQKVGSRAVL